MKWTAAICILFLSLSCKSAKQTNKDFSIISAEKQTFFGGAVGSPVVTLYKMKLKALRSFTFQADSAWAEGKIDAVLIDIDSFNTAHEKDLKKGDELNLHFEIRSESVIGGGDYQLKTPGSREIPAPVDVKNGVLMYYKGGSSKYLIFSDIITKEPVMAP